jgi:hypothetical protein
MMSTSARVRHLLSEVRKLSEDERAELEAELFAEDLDVERVWGEEVDRRAQRVLGGEVRGLDREELAALLGLPPAEARAQLSKILASRR